MNCVSFHPSESLSSNLLCEFSSHVSQRKDDAKNQFRIIIWSSITGTLFRSTKFSEPSLLGQLVRLRNRGWPSFLPFSLPIFWVSTCAWASKVSNMSIVVKELLHTMPIKNPERIYCHGVFRWLFKYSKMISLNGGEEKLPISRKLGRGRMRYEPSNERCTIL